MFGIDFSEILVIFGIALVVLGPEKLPKLAATIGHWIGRARAMARQFREQLEVEAKSLHHGVDLDLDLSMGKPKDSKPPADPAPPGAAPQPGATAPQTESVAAAAVTPAATAPSAPSESATGDVNAGTAAEPLHESIWPFDGPA